MIIGKTKRMCGLYGFQDVVMFCSKIQWVGTCSGFDARNRPKATAFYL